MITNTWVANVRFNVNSKMIVSLYCLSKGASLARFSHGLVCYVNLAVQDVFSFGD